MKTKNCEYKSPTCSQVEVCDEGLLCLSNFDGVDSSNEEFEDLKDFEW